MPNNNMPEKTKIALLECIAKYEHAAQIGELPNLGPDDCALCRLFNHGIRDLTIDPPFCTGCPVREATGRPFCEDTPYEAVLNATESEIAAACADEAEFLKSLLPQRSNNHVDRADFCPTTDWRDTIITPINQ